MSVHIHPPTYFVAAATAMAALNRWLPGWVIGERYRWMAVVPLLAACILGAWSLALFLLWRTTAIPYRQPKVLLTTGPYSVTRNPLYLSMTLMLVGIAITMGSVTCWLIIPLFVLCIDRLVIPWEDQALEACFGDYYRQYRHRVRRWLGMPRPRINTPRI